MHIGAEVVDPEFFGPGGFGGGFGVEEDDVGPDTPGVEDAGTTGGIDHGVGGFGLHHFHPGLTGAG